MSSNGVMGLSTRDTIIHLLDRSVILAGKLRFDRCCTCRIVRPMPVVPIVSESVCPSL